MPALFRFWGELTEALTHRRAAERGQARRRPLRRASTAIPDRLSCSSRRMTGLSLGSARGHRRQVPVGQIPDLRRHWRGPGWAAGAGGARRIRTSPASASTCRWSGRSSTITCADRDSSGRLTFHGGDFFNEPLPTADVLVMGHILHDWDLDQKRMLIGKAYRRAARRRGAASIYEIIDRRRAPAERLRPADEPEHADRDPRRLRLHGRRLHGWMKEAGFGETRVEHLAGPDSMVIGIK